MPQGSLSSEADFLVKNGSRKKYKKLWKKNENLSDETKSVLNSFSWVGFSIAQDFLTTHSFLSLSSRYRSDIEQTIAQ